jgi:hypothetical protein
VGFSYGTIPEFFAIALLLAAQTPHRDQLADPKDLVLHRQTGRTGGKIIPNLKYPYQMPTNPI